MTESMSDAELAAAAEYYSGDAGTPEFGAGVSIEDDLRQCARRLLPAKADEDAAREIAHNGVNSCFDEVHPGPVHTARCNALTIRITAALAAQRRASGERMRDIFAKIAEDWAYSSKPDSALGIAEAIRTFREGDR